MEATFWDHVEELRIVFIRSLFVIGLGIATALFFYQDIFGILTSPLQTNHAVKRNEVRFERIHNPHSYDIDYRLGANERIPGSESTITIPAHGNIVIEKTITSSPLLVLGPIEGMLTTFKMAFWIGLVATSPFWMYFLFSFIAPALEPSQRKMVIPFIGLSMMFIMTGISFAFYITIPFANQYLQLFNESIGTNLWTLSNYLDYTVILLLANGLAFEFAVILLFLVHYGVLHPESMAKKRRHMIVAAFVIGALLTPPDILTQILMAIPLIILYELIIVYGFVRNRKKYTTGVLVETPVRSFNEL